MAGIIIPFQWTVTGQNEVIDSVKKVEQSLKNINAVNLREQLKLGTSGIAGELQLIKNIIDSLGKNSPLAKSFQRLTDTASKRPLTVGELQEFQSIGNAKDSSGKALISAENQTKFFAAFIKEQNSVVNRLIRELEDAAFTGGGTLFAQDGTILLSELKRVILQNINSLAELKIVTEKDIKDISRALEKGDLKSVATRLESIRSYESFKKRVTKNPFEIGSESSQALLEQMGRTNVSRGQAESLTISAYEQGLAKLKENPELLTDPRFKEVIQNWTNAVTRGLDETAIAAFYEETKLERPVSSKAKSAPVVAAVKQQAADVVYRVFEPLELSQEEMLAIIKKYPSQKGAKKISANALLNEYYTPLRVLAPSILFPDDDALLKQFPDITGSRTRDFLETLIKQGNTQALTEASVALLEGQYEKSVKSGNLDLFTGRVFTPEDAARAAQERRDRIAAAEAEIAKNKAKREKAEADRIAAIAARRPVFQSTPIESTATQNADAERFLTLYARDPKKFLKDYVKRQEEIATEEQKAEKEQYAQLALLRRLNQKNSMGATPGSANPPVFPTTPIAGGATPTGGIFGPFPATPTPAPAATPIPVVTPTGGRGRAIPVMPAGGGTGGGGGGGGGVPGGVPFGLPPVDPIDDYLREVSSRFTNISAAFQNANDIARGSLRSITTQSIEEFALGYAERLNNFRDQTQRILVQAGATIGMNPADSQTLARLITGTSQRLAGSPEFLSLSEAEKTQRARLFGETELRNAFPSFNDVQIEKALKIFTQQVVTTSSSYKQLNDTIDNINVELARLNREEVNVLISRIRSEDNPDLAEEARQLLRQRLVAFFGQDFNLVTKREADLTDAERAALPPKVANDIASNKNTTERGINQALGTPRTAFEQLATAGGRLAAIISLFQFTIGSTIQALQQFTDQANRLERVSATVNALAGSLTGYTKVLNLAVSQQQKFGGTLEENLQGLSSLIPVSQRYGADLQQLDNIARRLAIVDPLQGFSGAAIALKEFFSGDITSLSRRFEIDRATLNSIKEAGDKTAQLQKLDEVLNNLGISNEVLTARTQTSAATFDRLGSTVSNLSTLFGVVLQDSFEGSASALDRWLGQWSSTIKNVQESNAIILEVSSGFAKLSTNANSIVNLRSRISSLQSSLNPPESDFNKIFGDSLKDRNQKQEELLNLQQQLTKELSKTKLEVNDLISKFNEASNAQLNFIQNTENARQTIQVAAGGSAQNILERQRRGQFGFGDYLLALAQDFSMFNVAGAAQEGGIFSGIRSLNQGGGVYNYRRNAAESLSNLIELTGQTNIPELGIGLGGANTFTEQFDPVRLANLAELMQQLVVKRNELSQPARITLANDISEATTALQSGVITSEEYIDRLLKIRESNYELGKSYVSVSENLANLENISKKQAANLAALNKPVLSTEVSYQLVLQTIGQIDEVSKKQTQTQLEQFALAQRYGSEYSKIAKAKNEEFKANKNLLKSEEFDRFELLRRYGEAIVLQANLTLEQEKSVGIIGILRKDMLGYNVTLQEAVNLAKELQNSIRGIATGNLLSSLPIGQQMQFQQDALRGNGPFAVRNQGEATTAYGNLINLEMKRADSQRQTGQRLADIAKDDAERRQKLQEEYNKDLLKMQEDYEKRKLELLKKSEVDKRQGKVDFYSSLMNADKLTPEQQKMLSGKYETLFGQVSELRNQGQFDKAASLLEAGTTQITNEMNYLQEVATQKENIKEADKDIAKLQEDYNKADSADSRKSILDKIEQRRQDKDTADNRIKQLGEIRTLQTDADNERVKTATEAEDKITDDYNKQVDERKKAYLDALKEQDAAYKKSVDSAKLQATEFYDSTVSNLNFITALGTFAETIPTLLKRRINTRDEQGMERLDKQITEAEYNLYSATPERYKTATRDFINALENQKTRFDQTQTDPNEPLMTSMDKAVQSTDKLREQIYLLNEKYKIILQREYGILLRGG